MISIKSLNISRVVGFLGFLLGLILLFIGFVGHSVIIILSLILLSIIHLTFGFKLIQKNYKIKNWFFFQGVVVCLLGLCYLEIIYYYVFQGLPKSNFGLISGISILSNLIFIGWGMVKNQLQKILKLTNFKYLSSLIFTTIICSIFFFFRDNYHVTFILKDKAYYYQHESTKLINKKEYSKAKYTALKSLKIEGINKETEALCYRNLGIISRIEEDFFKSDSLLDLSYKLMRNSSSHRKNYYLKDIESHYSKNNENKKHQSAVDKFTRITLEEPNNATAFNELGAAYHNLKKYDLAIKNYTKAIQLNPNFVNAYGNRGISKDNLGDKKGAISDYNKAIELDSSYSFAYNNRGYIYKSLGDYDQAVEDFNKAIELNPKIENAVGNIIMSYKELNDCKKVLEWCNYHIDNFPARDTIYEVKAACIVQLRSSDSTNYK